VITRQRIDLVQVLITAVILLAVAALGLKLVFGWR
jgi:hypothetical protein